jgi:hypothetical protein
MEGTFGGPIAAGLTKGALDIGDLVIAPRLADLLVAKFPGVFIPASTASLAQRIPFGHPATSVPTRSSQTVEPANGSNDSGKPGQLTATPAVISVPVHVSSAPTATPKAPTTNLEQGSLQSPSNAWLVAIMNNPKNSLAERQIAAIALGIDPDKLTIKGQILDGTYKTAAQPSNAAGITDKTPAPSNSTSKNSASQPSTASNSSPASAPASSPSQTTSTGPKTVHTVPIKGDSTANVLTAAAAPAALPTQSSVPSQRIQQPSTFAIQPGGISLTRAAAERMPLNFSIEGSFVKDGRIVLSGHKDTEGSIDAALFLTALRATCEGRDPYFSLDPDDTATWLLETKNAGQELFAHIKKDTAWSMQRRATRNTPSVLKFRTLSASQNYPAFWSSMLSKYPNLRSRLVFGPEWLRQTRFGEILYKADVLLKELAGGVPALGTNSLRATKIDGYVSATQITAAKGLLSKYHNLNGQDTALAGGRIWYDLTETSGGPAPTNAIVPIYDSELYTLLRTRRLLPSTSANSSIRVSLSRKDGLLDISQVYPRMYVRIRDPVTLRDGTGSFPGVDELVAEANAAPQKYAVAYREYQALVEVFRAYVAAVHARTMEPRLCSKLPKELMDAEKISIPMPAYHSTDFALTVAWYEYSEGRFRRAIGMTGGLYQGGVSVGATALFNQAGTSTSDTPILRELKLEASKTSHESVWVGAENRRYISFTLDSEEPSAAPERHTPKPSLASIATKMGVPIEDTSSLEASGKIGRFDLHNGGRIQGENLASVPLDSQFSKSAGLAQKECAQLCSDDNECIAFEIDQKRSVCGTYSSISKIISAPNWTHGVWK